MYQGLPPVHRCGTYLCSWDTRVGFQWFMVFKGFWVLDLEPDEGSGFGIHFLCFPR